MLSDLLMDEPARKRQKKGLARKKPNTSATTSKPDDTTPSLPSQASSKNAHEVIQPTSPSPATSSHAQDSMMQSETKLQCIPDGYHGFYSVFIDGKEKIMTTFPTPRRTAQDHSYAQSSAKSATITQSSQKKLSFDEDMSTVNSATNAESGDPLEDLYSDIPQDSDNDAFTESEIETFDADSASQYSPGSSEIETDTETESDNDSQYDTESSLYDGSYPDDLKTEKFIVFESKLLELMKFCQKCGAPINEYTKSTKGPTVTFHIECLKDCKYTWKSQSDNATLLLSSGILTTGNTFTKVASFSAAINLKFMGESTYTEHQTKTVIPAIEEEWEGQKAKAVEEVKTKKNLVLAGDARCDSPGYNAKYGSYTLMDATPGTNKKKIVSLQLVQVSEVKNSNHMEPEGLKRCLAEVKEKGLTPSTKEVKEKGLTKTTLATDRHLTVASLMKKDYKYICHQYDIWHLVKSIMKKLMAKAKVKKCEGLQPWIKSISNHFWWCAESCRGNEQLLKEKWLSLLQHICNKHRWTGSRLFHKCAHQPLSREEQADVAWLDRKGEAFKALHSVVTDKRLLNALPHVTKFCHTGEIEVFHSMLLKYCPKRQHFHYDAMKARLLLAALDWNSQTRTECVDKHGKVKESVVWSKKSGKWVKKVEYHTSSGNHIAPLMKKCLEHKASGVRYEVNRPALPSHVAKDPKPDATTVKRWSRFHKK